MLNTELKQVIESRYRDLELISGGTFGLVYSAQDRETQEKVAIKVFNAGNYKSSVNELKLLFRLKHPNIVKILDVFYLKHSYALVFEYINGGDLRARIENQTTPISEKESIMIMAQIAAGLHYIHKNNIVHLDLKPENILVQHNADQSIYKLADFNISRFQDTQHLGASYQGSAIYMAPEQFYQNADQKSDFYSLGIIWFELLTGSPPFEGLLKELMKAHIQFAVPFERCQASEPVLDILKSLLAKDPQQRPATSQILLDSLTQLVEKYSLETLSSQRTSLQWDPEQAAFYLKYLDPEIRSLLFPNLIS